MNQSHPKTARDYRGNRQKAPHPTGMRMVWTDGESITLWAGRGRQSPSRFALVYGLQATHYNSYDAAAGALGSALMHACACGGLLDE